MHAGSSNATAAITRAFRFFMADSFRSFPQITHLYSDAPIENTRSSIDFSGFRDDQYSMFASREDAGRRLGHYLLEHGARPDIVLGLPRGGVVVAAEVAN